MDDIKQFLYAWLGKQSKTPEYEVQTNNNKNRQRFKCDVRINFLKWDVVGWCLLRKILIIKNLLFEINSYALTDLIMLVLVIPRKKRMRKLMLH